MYFIYLFIYLFGLIDCVNIYNIILNGKIVKLMKWKDPQKRCSDIIGIIPVFCLKELKKKPLGQFVTCLKSESVN
jgi:hypothetical protein